MFFIRILSPLQTSFTIKTNCSTLVNALLLKHGIYASLGAHRTDYTIVALKEKGSYTITFGNDYFTTDAPLRKIENLMYENRKYNENIFAIHGGAIEHNGRAYLMVASTSSGKTTLTSYLVSRGFGYITDDCVLLDTHDFNVHPFTTPIHLRGGGYDLLNTLGCAPKDVHLLKDTTIQRYVYTPNNCATQPIPLAKLFFITRTERDNRVEEMSTIEKMSALLHSPIINYEINSEHLSFISRLAHTSCQKLYYSDMAFVYEVIKHGS